MTSDKLKRWAVVHPIVLFVILSYSISWAFWIPAGMILESDFAQIAHLAGAFGPMISALILVALRGGSVRTWIASLFKWRVHPVWYVFALLFPTFLIGIMSGFYLALGYDLDVGILPERLSSYVPTLAFMTILGGGNEEPGWRGFALLELMKSHPPVIATLILGLIWGVWHAPILLSNPQVMSGEMPASALLILVGVTLVSITVHAFWYTWLFNQTKSILLCILLHGSYNTANWLLVLVGPEALSGQSYQTLLTLMTSVLVGSVAVLLVATRGRLGAP